MRGRFDFSNTKTRLILLSILMAVIILVMVLVFIHNRQTEKTNDNTTAPVVETKKDPAEPKLEENEIMSGLVNPWEVVFLANNILLVNERDGRLSKIENNEKSVISEIRDVYGVGEGGLTGLALDSDFAKNRFIYTCYNARTASGLDVRVVRWKLAEDNNSLTDRRDIITGIPSNSSGRHSGCRLRSDTEGNLWVGTGDAANASHPQNPESLGGKILRVTRDGMPASGNLPAPFDPRIFSYGHRNVQGIVLFEEPQNGLYGYSIEHGSDIDDEINLLKNGNFGWAPRPFYNERGVPMTDTERFPEAISAIWSSGSSTIAPSGGTLLSGDRWGTWDGAIAMAVLKNRHVRIMKFDQQNNLMLEKEILSNYGRVRSANLGPDESLYITTDNGRNDKIIKITPSIQ